MLTLSQLLETAASDPVYRGWPLHRVSAWGGSHWEALPTLPRGVGSEYVPGEFGALLFLSSGSTGSANLYGYGSHDLERVAALCARFTRLEGVSAGARVLVLLPMALWSVGKLTTIGHLRAGGRVLPADLCGGAQSWQSLADQWQPRVISSTPSVLDEWAASYRGPRVEVLETTGEPLTPEARERIEAAFGGRVHDAYGLTECVVGVECSEACGYHFWPDAVGVEVLQPQADQPVPPGEVGELVVTSFMQTARPVLRFRTGDLGRLARRPCPCGDPAPRVHLLGRVVETLDAGRGVTLHTEDLVAELEHHGIHAHVAWQPGVSSRAEEVVGGSGRSVLQVRVCKREGAELRESRIRELLVAGFPDLAELLHEDVLRFVVTWDEETE